MNRDSVETAIILFATGLLLGLAFIFGVSIGRESGVEKVMLNPGIYTRAMESAAERGTSPVDEWWREYRKTK